MGDSVEYVQPVERVRVFVDYWNLQLGARDKLKRNFQPDWKRIPQWLGVEAVRLAVGDPNLVLRLEGLNAYLSYKPASEADRKFKTWASNFLDRVPSVQVICKERKPRYAPVVRRATRRLRFVLSAAPPWPGLLRRASMWLSPRT